MSNYPNSHLYCQNNIYKIVLSFEDQQEIEPEGNDDENNDSIGSDNDKKKKTTKSPNNNPKGKEHSKQAAS